MERHRALDLFLAINFCNLLLCSLAYSQFVPVASWTPKPATLSFTGSSQTFYNKICSGVETIRMSYGEEGAMTLPSDLEVNLSSLAGLTYYADRFCTEPITTLTIPEGASTGSFYFSYTGVGSISLTASATNWAGSTVPGSNDQAIFDSACSPNCDVSLAAHTSVKGIRLEETYTGQFNQGNYNFTIGNKNFVMYAGTFNGSASATPYIRVDDGHVIVLGGVLNLPAGTFRFTHRWQIASSVTVSVPSDSRVQHYSKFSWSSGPTIIFDASHFDYENLILRGYRGAMDFLGHTMTVNKDFTFGSSAPSNQVRINNATFFS